MTTFSSETPKIVNNKGAVDLTSVIIGLIVLAVITGVISAIVFIVIPWSQDNATKRDLEEVVKAEEMYYGTQNADTEKYANLATLLHAQTLTTYETHANSSTLDSENKLCVSVTDNSTKWQALKVSSTGNLFYLNKDNPTPTQIGTPSNPLTNIGSFINTECSELTGLSKLSTINPATLKLPTTVFTLKQQNPTDTQTLPIVNIQNNENNALYLYKGAYNTTAINILNGICNPDQCTEINTNTTDETIQTTKFGTTQPLDQNQEYQVVFKGYFTDLTNTNPTQTQPLLQDIPYYNPKNTGTTSLRNAFQNAYYFTGNPNMNNWDTSDITSLEGTFYNTPFNQPLNDWDTTKVTTTASTFAHTHYNQPLNNWKTGNVTTMTAMFTGTPYNQPLNEWDTSNTTDMTAMFAGTPYNQPLNNWNVSKVTNMNYMLLGTPYNQNLNTWNPTSLITHINFNDGGLLTNNQLPSQLQTI